jgi:hypothetical protein
MSRSPVPRAREDLLPRICGVKSNQRPLKASGIGCFGRQNTGKDVVVVDRRSLMPERLGHEATDKGVAGLSFRALDHDARAGLLDKEPQPVRLQTYSPPAQTQANN